MLYNLPMPEEVSRKFHNRLPAGRRIAIFAVQIDEAAFQGNEAITDTQIPGTVKTVGRFAFNGCTNLGSVALGTGVRRIESQAFSGCISLQAVNTPSTLTEIDPEAFSNTGERLILLD